MTRQDFRRLERVLGLALLASLVHVAPATAGTYSRTGQANVPIFEQSYYLYAGNTYEWETSGLYSNFTTPSCTSTPDTVMRLTKWGSYVGGLYRDRDEVARDDDGGTGRASKINYTPTSSGWYQIVVHGYDTTSCGIMNLSFNGGTSFNLLYGGVRERFASVSSGDKIETTFAPGGAYGHQLLVAAKPNGAMSCYQNANLTSGNDTAHLSCEYSGVTNERYVYYSATNSFIDNDMGVHQNTSFDSDGDGLGDSLENEIGTCATLSSSVSGWTCNTQDPEDTDNDGLDDYVEVVGAYTSSGINVADDTAPLPLWGSSPRHKNVFIEVDENNFTTMNTLAQNVNIPIWRDTLAGNYSQGLASEVGNPDGINGVHVHFDVAGVPPIDVGDNKMLHFDGGGSNQIPVGMNCGQQGTLRSSEQSALRQTLMHYMCANPGGGGSAREPGLTITSSIHERVVSHELGHNLDLNHGGAQKYNGTPHYRSLMNYVYTANLPFSGGEYEAYPLNPSKLYEWSILPNNAWLGQAPWNYTVDTYGQVDWDRDGTINFNPVAAPITWSPIHGTSAFTKVRDTFAHGTPARNVNNTPSVARFEAGGVNRLYVFRTVGTESEDQFIRYSHMEVDADGKCTNHADEVANTNGETCGSWTHVTGPRWARGASAVSFDPLNATPAMYIAIRRPSGHIEVFRAEPGSTGTLTGSWTFTRVSTSSTLAQGDPDITTDGNSLVVVWRTTGGVIQHAKMNSNGVWTTATSTGLTTTIDPSVAYNPSTNRTQLVYASSTGAIQVRKSSSSFSDSNFVADTTYSAASAFSTDAKVGVAWYKTPNTEFLKLAYRRDPTAADQDARVLMFEPSGLRVGLMGNTWTRPTSGIDYLYHPGDSNLHSTISATVKMDSNWYYFPYADGLIDIELVDTNDHERMSQGICRGFRTIDSRPCGIPGAIVSPISSEDVECDVEQP